jgi:dTDP-4-dehydrorhamnose reductase
MRILIAGWHGQVAQALAELAPGRAEIKAFAVGRPALDLCSPSSIQSNLVESRPDIMINTAAFTAVDDAESEPDKAFALNREGAAAFAGVAARKGIPVIHVSTDYVFDGAKKDPYTEEDTTGPINAYGVSKLEGERAVADANPRHVILRTAWVHSPWSRNFVKTMLALARDRDEIGVVDDQVGCPTYALDLASAILDVAVQIGSGTTREPWGVYHAASAGGASWCGLARRVFEASGAHGGPVARVNAIASADYPTPARRLANSRLDCAKLERIFGVRLPDWQRGVDACVQRLLKARDVRGHAG